MKKKNHNRKCRDIVDAASRVIIKKGVENTSLEDIAKEVGMSKGALYYYYPSKNDLLLDVSEKHVKEILDYIIQKRDKSNKNISQAVLLKELFEGISRNELRTRLHLNLIQQAITGNERIREKLAGRYKDWIRNAEEGLKSTITDEYDRTLIAQLIIAAIDGLNIQLILGTGEIPFEKVGSFFAR
jgi:AcrR family transcriptional regulator